MVIGIDPDATKSGFAVVDKDDQGKDCVVEAEALTFPALIDRLQYYTNRFPLVVIEAGWLNKSTWHGAYQKGARVAARIGNNTGANQQTGKLIAEVAEHYGLKIQLQKPLLKRWNGPDGKITAEELRLVTGYQGRTNQDVRDAVLVAWHYR